MYKPLVMVTSPVYFWIGSVNSEISTLSMVTSLAASAFVLTARSPNVIAVSKVLS